ncbi:MAG: tetratricopeptide repeat protein [Burkholderiales bacterium]
MNETPEHLEATIAALEAQRALLGDAVVDSALAPLRRELAVRRNPESAAPQQRLKQVSVLFVDVVGSTAMGQNLLPEDIQSVMDGALQRFTAIVEAQRGRVLQYTGDGMLAAFGAAESQEDDAERAVLAALGILEEAKQHARQALAMHRIADFNVRTGIHTGTVLLGGGVDAEGSIRGGVVNVAARMEQSAPPGGLRISEATYQQVRGMFDVAEQAPMSVKGIDVPVRNHLVVRAKPSTARLPLRGIEGVQTRLVGRERELETLIEVFGQVVSAQERRAVTLVGDAGLGKTRLLDEFRQALDVHDTGCHLLLGRAHPRSALQPYGLLRDLIARMLQIDDADDTSAACTKLVEGIAPLHEHGGEAAAHLIGHLIGLDFAASPHVELLLQDATGLRDQAFDALTTFLQRLSIVHEKPVAVVFDDLHWADTGSLEFVERLMHAGMRMPLLVLMLTRPELIHRRGSWFDADPHHARIDLAPLDKAGSERLAESLLQRIDEVPVALRALITGSAEGNPFYMEELVKLLLDDGVIAVDAEGWRVVPDKLLRVRVPATLTGVLQVRLDALQRGERSALQHAAVIGQVFSEQALALMDSAAPAALPALQRRQLIVVRDATSIDGEREFSFQHNLLYQVAYDGVIKGVKQAGHAKMGAYWSERAEVQSPQQVTSAASRALAEAHYHRCLSDAPSYVGWFDAQFSHYLNAWAAQALRPLAEALIGVCRVQFGADHPQTAKALTNHARALLQLGATDEAEPLLQRAITIQEIDPGAEHPDTARTVAVLGGCFIGRGNHAAAEPLFRRALAIRERSLGNEHPLTVAVLDLLAQSVAELGRNAEAELLSRRVLEIRERLLGPDHPETCLALTALGDILSKRQDHASAEPLIRRALAAQQRTLPAEHPDTGLSLWNLSEALQGLGRLEEAEPLARASLQMWEKTLGPQHEWTAWSLSSLAKLRLAQGDAGDAARLSRRAIEIHQRALGEDHPTVAENLELLARALLALADPANAEPLLRRALDIRAGRLASDDPATQATRDLLAALRASAEPG